MVQRNDGHDSCGCIDAVDFGFNGHTETGLCGDANNRRLPYSYEIGELNQVNCQHRRVWNMVCTTFKNGLQMSSKAT